MSKELSKEELRKKLFQHTVLIKWLPEYDLGIPIIDEQHRGIVTTINSLHYGMALNHGEKMLKPVVNMMIQYTHIHFEIEESFLERCEYPELSAHRELHAGLARTLSDIGNKSMWDKNPHEFLEFLKNWWINHICGKDRKFKDYLLTQQH